MRSVLVTAGVLSLLAIVPARAGPFAALGGDRPIRASKIAPPTSLLVPSPPDEVRRRIDAYMVAQDFQQTEPAKSAPNEVGYARLVGATAFHDAADCTGLGVGSPKLWIETLVVTLEPGTGGTRVVSRGEFKVLLNGLVSEKPFTLACRSRGVLEDRLFVALKTH